MLTGASRAALADIATIREGRLLNSHQAAELTTDQIAGAVIGAAEVGYRYFDCASVYGNEDAVGRSLQTIMRGDVPREDLCITSKVWHDQHGRVIEACRQSLRDLQLEYFDLYLVHWPFPNFHANDVDASACDPQGGLISMKTT